MSTPPRSTLPGHLTVESNIVSYNASITTTKGTLAPSWWRAMVFLQRMRHLSMPLGRIRVDLKRTTLGRDFLVNGTGRTSKRWMHFVISSMKMCGEDPFIFPFLLLQRSFGTWHWWANHSIEALEKQQFQRSHQHFRKECRMATLHPPFAGALLPGDINSSRFPRIYDFCCCI